MRTTNNVGQFVTINSRSFDGSIRRTWEGRLAKQARNLLVVAGEFDADVPHDQLGLIERGTITHEYYWLDRWYNIFRFDNPDGTFRNYYCNVCMPPTFDKGVLDYVDLDLDVVAWPDSRVEILDEADFERNAAKYAYPDPVKEDAAAALKTLSELAASKTWPDDQPPFWNKLC